MTADRIVLILTSVSGIIFGVLERWEKIEVARTLANACAATTGAMQ